MRRRDRAASGRDFGTAARASVRAAALFVAAALVALGPLSCAGSKKLTEQSEKALAQGEVDRAYGKARSALRKDPENERARDALRSAAERKAAGMKERVRAVATATDTVAAARYCLDLDAFRRELAEYRVMPTADPAFDREASTLRHAAARTLVRRADEAMDAGSPRTAHRDLEAARELEAAYPDLDRRLREAYAQALHRIAILPVANQTEAGGLGRELTDQLYRELPGRIREPDFPFTMFLPRSEIHAKVTLAQAEDMGTQEAVDIGRELDADLIVRGRVYALSTEANNDSWHGTVFRRIAERDSSGRNVERYVEVPLDIVGRTRRVSVRYEIEVRGTRDGAVVAVHDETVGAVARVVHTSYRAEGDCKDYVLVSPVMRRSDSRGAEARERDWRAHCGSWELPAFLESARKESRRSYASSMRGEFFVDTQARPVYLAELPPMEELAAAALREAWSPVSRALRDVER